MKIVIFVFVNIFFWFLNSKIDDKFYELKKRENENQKELFQKIDRLQNTIDSLKQLK